MPSPPRSYTSFPTQEDLFYFCTTSSPAYEEDLDIHQSSSPRSSLKIGVVIIGKDPIQLFDLAALDLLAMMSRNRLSQMNPPVKILEESVDEIDIRYVSLTGEGSFQVSSGARMPVTNSFANAPQFDILYIPGSFSSPELPTSALAFFSAQTSHPAYLATFAAASGILHLAQTGELHDKRAACPPTLRPALQASYPETIWDDRPSTRDGKVWSSASAGAALEMGAAWLKEYFWDREGVLEFVCGIAGVGNGGTGSVC